MKERFPGEREPDTAMGSQPGIVGTTGFGLDLPAGEEEATMDADTARERAIEGGGAEAARPHGPSRETNTQDADEGKG